MTEHLTARPRKPLPQLADYPHQTADTIRYGDLDSQGHVNNAVFSTYFETGRLTMLWNADLGIAIAGATYVLVRTEIDFLQELHWPGAVTIGTAVAEFGRSSFTVMQAIFHNGTCAASGRATLVMLDSTSRRAQPLPDDEISRLNQWKYRGA